MTTASRALILAAGQGTRLRPLTDDRPKTLVPLLGKTLFERQVDTLRACGVDDIAVATGYRADQLAAYGLPTFFNPAFASTNMVESLFAAREFIAGSTGDFLIGYGDIVYHRENLQRVLESDGEIALMIDKGWLDLWTTRQEDPLNDAETLRLTPDNHITELGRKPKTLADIEGQYTGLIKIRADKVADFLAFYDAMDRAAPVDGRAFEQMYMTSFLQALIDAGWKVKAALVNHGWLEVDSVEDLTTYERLHAEGKLAALYHPEA